MTSHDWGSQFRSHAPNLPKDYWPDGEEVKPNRSMRTTTLPRIGRLIHVRGYDKCRAAIVTGEDYMEEIKMVYVEIFAPNLKPQEAVLWLESAWHYVDECTV